MSGLKVVHQSTDVGVAGRYPFEDGNLVSDLSEVIVVCRAARTGNRSGGI